MIHRFKIAIISRTTQFIFNIVFNPFFLSLYKRNIETFILMQKRNVVKVFTRIFFGVWSSK